MTSLDVCKMNVYCSRKNRCQSWSISHIFLEDFKFR